MGCRCIPGLKIQTWGTRCRSCFSAFKTQSSHPVRDRIWPTLFLRWPRSPTLPSIPDCLRTSTPRRPFWAPFCWTTPPTPRPPRSLRLKTFRLTRTAVSILRMSELMDAQRAVDIVTLANELARYKEVESVGGVAYLASLTEGLPRRPVIEEYIRIVKDKSLLRKLMGICSIGDRARRRPERDGDRGAGRWPSRNFWRSAKRASRTGWSRWTRSSRTPLAPLTIFTSKAAK